MPLTRLLIDAVIERYWRELDRYEKLAVYVGEACQQLLDKHAIRGSVQWRAKDPGRLRGKLEKYLVTGERAAEFVDLDSVFRVLKDLAGARITTYIENDRSRVVALVQQRFRGFGTGLTIIPDVKDQPTQFYRATHCLVQLKDEDALGIYKNLKGLACEIQVCSQLAHVYNEIEHDLRYKPLSGAPSKQEHELLNAFAQLMEVCDTISNQLRESVATRQRETTISSASWRRPEPMTHARRRSALESVVQSPVLVEISGLVKASRPDDDLPETPTAFYEEAMLLLAKGAWAGGGAAVVSSAEEVLSLLRPTAWRIFSEHPSSIFDRETAIASIVLATGCTPKDAVTLAQRLVDLGFWSCSVRETKEEFCFRDTTFCDFLAAAHVAAAINRANWEEAEIEVWQEISGSERCSACAVLDAHAFEPRWERLFIFVAGLLQNPLPLIDLLADRNRDDLYRHRLGLLCRCYRGLSVARAAAVQQRMETIFKEVLRIARRCAKDDLGHRKPWMEWVEVLLLSPDAGAHLCEALLDLDGGYHGWTVAGKVLELLESVLPQAGVPTTVVASIAAHAERDEHHWSVNTAFLALRIAEGGQRRAIVERYASIIEAPDTPVRVRIRLAEAVASWGETAIARRASEIVLALAQDDALAFEHRSRAVQALVSLLNTGCGSIAASVLVYHLLNPSSEQNFWLAWRIIGAADEDPVSSWSAVLLTVILFADREDDQRLRLWSGQVLANRTEPSLRELGLRTLWELTRCKKSHAWVYAARWLVEHGPLELGKRARQTLLNEASDQASDQRLEATAELLAMGTIGPLGEPIEVAVREAVLRELEDYGKKYGPRLHISVPGAPTGNVDRELFHDNPATVIRLLHTFHGPSPYLRDRGDPNDEKERTQYWSAELLSGTRYWPEVYQQCFATVDAGIDCDRHGALGIVLFGGSSKELVELLWKTMSRGIKGSMARHHLLEELNERGWRFRLHGRQFEILRQGREERANSEDLGKRSRRTAGPAAKS
jgi:ppGpp synthetase/RelA/SpoT-type nucleotidyltranferase